MVRYNSAQLFIRIAALCCFALALPLHAEADLDGGVKSLAEQIAKNMQSNNKKKIAVIEFSNLNGGITEFGQVLAEELITQLFLVNVGKFDVVERQQLQKIINEHQLGASGLLDGAAMGKIGKILGVDAIVTGSISDRGNSAKINARLIAVDTGMVFAVAATDIPKVGTVATLMSTLAPGSGANAQTANTPTEASNKAKDAEPTGSSKKDVRKRIEVKGVMVELEGCNKSGAAIVCKLFVTSSNDDKTLNVVANNSNAGAPSRMIDESGEEFLSTQVSIGAKSGGYIRHTFVSGIPTKMLLRFEKTSASTSALKLLELAIAGSTAQFRNVTLSN